MIKNFFTDSGIPIESVYTLENLEKMSFDYQKDLGLPGKWPYTRGIDPEMYRGQQWIESVYMGFGSPEDCNKKLRNVLKEGKEVGLQIAMDLPTQLGLDSDHPIASPEVGRVGVAIDSLQDMEILFDRVDIERLRFIGTPACSIGPIMLAMFIALGEKNGIPPKEYKVVLANDALKEFVSRGTYIFPPKQALKLATDTIEYCANNIPSWAPIHVHGGSFLDSGSTAIQEIGFSLAFILAYIESTLERGLGIDDFVHMFSLRLYTGMDFFESVAKFRALRRMWARLMRERFGAKDEKSLKLDLQISTSGASLTAQQPVNNIVRVALQALAAVLAGGQKIRCAAMDEGLSTPTEETLKVALRTQQIIFHETGVAHTVDPLGGSYYVEYLTKKLEEEAMVYVEKVDEMGGILQALEQRFFQSEIEKASYKLQKAVENGEKVIVGVNEYVEKEEIPIKIVKREPGVVRNQVVKLKRLKDERDNDKVRGSLDRLKGKANNGENL
ncbi:MAG: methylmalonyl-CoA mutase family protein, partial [Thermodesulfobacteriota bacterium]